VKKGTARAPKVKNGGANNGDSANEQELDKFDPEGLNKAPITGSNRSEGRIGRKNNRPGSNRSQGSGSGKTIREKLYSVASFRGKAKSDRSRGAPNRPPKPGSSSNHSKNNDQAVVPYEESENLDSFHGDVATDSINHNGAIVPTSDRSNDDSYVDYDENKLRPPPKVKLAREDSDVGAFPDDTWWQKCLRHFRIMKPHPDEDDLKRQIRYLIWSTLILDVLVAVVSIATFGDGVTSCCGTAVMAAGVSIDWDTFMQVITWIYLVGIFLEIHPVVREGPIPWNLLNPFFGFLISFAVFVDDSKAEAISIWILELSSVILELVTYRRLRQVHNRKIKRLEELEDDIAAEKYSMGYRKTAFLRERRETRLVVSESEKSLRYHFIGATVNAALVCITMMLIVVVARGGGLCLVGGEGEASGLDIFNSDQKSRCFKCEDENGFTGPCRLCTGEGQYEEPDQCYFPYF